MMNQEEQGQDGSQEMFEAAGADAEEQISAYVTGRHGRKRWSPTWFWGAAILLAGLAAGIGGTLLGFHWVENLRRHVTVRDALVSGEKVPLTASMEGRIDSITIEEGDRVNPGQVIATLENATLQAQIERARTEVRKLETQLRKTESGLEELRQRVPREMAQSAEAVQASRSRLKAAQERLKRGAGDSDRGQIVYGSGPGHLSRKRQAAAEVEAAKNELKRAEARRQAVKAKKNLLDTKSRFAAAAANRLEKARAGLELAMKKTDAATIVSHVSGVVSQKARSSGDPVKPGEAVAFIVDLQRLWIDAFIELSEARRVVPGQSAEIRLESCPGNVFNGRIVQVGGGRFSPHSEKRDPATQEKGLQESSKIPVRIEFLPVDQQVRPGMKASVVIDTRTG